MKTKTKTKKTLATIDLETDPFEFGAEILPFAAGVTIEGAGHFSFWGDQCVHRAMAFLESWDEPLLVYAHNGGKFDFFFLMEHLENPMRIINARVVKAKFGRHEFRDSFAIIPTSLAKFDKIDIDYVKFKRAARERNRDEILRYLEQDCGELLRLVRAFIDRFGERLTIAGTAMRELERLHPQTWYGPGHDAAFRDFYFGGRVEYFEQGVLSGDWKLYDVNSMYSAVMGDCWHPLGNQYITVFNPEITPKGWIKGYPNRMYFIEVEGINRGALPVRTPEGLTFTRPDGVFRTTSHELVPAVQMGVFKATRGVWAKIPMQVQRFNRFTEYWAAEKKAAEDRGDTTGRYFAKTIPNSAYGKFAQNPTGYKDHWLEIFDRVTMAEVRKHEVEGWVPTYSHAKFRVWTRPSNGHGSFRDVAIAASITSAARGVLMRALVRADRPAYCDTDSVICRELRGVPIDPQKIGAWKLEASGTKLAIAGKKLYALFDGAKCVKKASKGVKIAPSAIVRVARGGEVVWKSDAPNFSLLEGTVKYIERRVRKAGNEFRIDGAKKQRKNSGAATSQRKPRIGK